MARINDYLLTIAIPTYNRMSVLPSLFNSFLDFQSLDTENNDVQFLFLNNDSTDGTKLFLESNIDRLKNGYIVNNSWNVGGDLNFIKCVNYANAEYVWLFGDDEIFFPDRLIYLIKQIKLLNADIFIQNVDFLNKNVCLNSISDLVNFLDFNSKLDYLLKMTLITNNIFRKNCFDFDFAYLNLHTNYSHVYAIFNNLYSSNLNIVLLCDANFKVREVREAFHIVPLNLNLKHKQLLLYFLKFLKIEI